MLAESEARLQMIEAAAVRGSSIADSELILKKLSARVSVFHCVGGGKDGRGN